MDVDFEVFVKQGIDESYPSDIPSALVPEYLAKKKAQSYKEDLSDGDLLITADTIVLLEDRILGKPHDTYEAKEMLGAISGRSHRVITGVALTSSDKQISFSEETIVRVGKLTISQLDYYIQNYKPFDKAGGYGIQEWFGHVAIDAIEGSFNNVMGLPTQRIFAEISSF